MSDQASPAFGHWPVALVLRRSWGEWAERRAGDLACLGAETLVCRTNGQVVELVPRQLSLLDLGTEAA